MKMMVLMMKAAPVLGVVAVALFAPLVIVVDSFAPSSSSLLAVDTFSMMRRKTAGFGTAHLPFHLSDRTPSFGIQRDRPQHRYMSSLHYDDPILTGTGDVVAVAAATPTTFLEDESSLNSNVVPPVTHLGLQTGTKNVLGSTLAAGISVAILAYGLASQNTAVAHQIAHFPDQLWDQYSAILEAHPIWTKASTSGFVYTIGDVIAQRTEQQSQQQQQQQQDSASATGFQWDMARTARSATAGFVGHGPLSHCWYNVCDHFFNDILHWTAWWSTLPKIAVDQTVWGPIWNNTYLLILGLLQRQTIANIWDDMKRSTVPLVVSGLKLWPAAHVVTYGLVPTENRLLWVDLVEIVWVTILASQAASLSHNDDPAKENENENASVDETSLRSTTTAI